MVCHPGSWNRCEKSMKKIIIIAFMALATVMSYAQTYKTVPNRPENNADIQIKNRALSDDKLNFIDGELNKYSDGKTPADRYFYNQKQLEKSGELFKKQ